MYEHELEQHLLRIGVCVFRMPKHRYEHELEQQLLRIGVCVCVFRMPKHRYEHELEQHLLRIGVCVYVFRMPKHRSHRLRGENDFRAKSHFFEVTPYAGCPIVRLHLFTALSIVLV